MCPFEIESVESLVGEEGFQELSFEVEGLLERE